MLLWFWIIFLFWIPQKKGSIFSPLLRTSCWKLMIWNSFHMFGRGQKNVMVVFLQWPDWRCGHGPCRGISGSMALMSGGPCKLSAAQLPVIRNQASAMAWGGFSLFPISANVQKRHSLLNLCVEFSKVSFQLAQQFMEMHSVRHLKSNLITRGCFPEVCVCVLAHTFRKGTAR